MTTIIGSRKLNDGTIQVRCSIYCDNDDHGYGVYDIRKGESLFGLDYDEWVKDTPGSFEFVDGKLQKQDVSVLLRRLQDWVDDYNKTHERKLPKIL